MNDRSKIISLRFVIGGQEVTRANWHKFEPNVTEGKLDTIAHSVYDSLGGMSCLEHQKEPAILCRGPSFAELQFEVTACCAKFKQQVEMRLDALHATTGCTVRR